MVHTFQPCLLGGRVGSLLLIILGVGWVVYVPSLVHAAPSSAVIYTSDFSSDPGWTTDQPENFYWDESRGALFARTQNKPVVGYTPSRHYITETTLNPRLSYALSFDMNVVAFGGSDGGSGVAVFGLFAKNLYGFNPLTINLSGSSQDGTFNTRMMQVDGSPAFIWTDVNTGANNDLSQYHSRSFQKNIWYTITQTYDGLTHTYSFSVRNRDTGSQLFSYAIQDAAYETVNPELRRLGISMHPEGTGATNMAYGARIDGYAEYLIDNVTLTQIYDETYTEPSSILFLPGIQSSRLYTKEGIGEDQVWEPHGNGDVATLALTAAGVSEHELYTKDVMSAAYGSVPIYEDFIVYLEKEKAAGRISDVELFAYDWRYSVDSVVRDGTQYEDEVRYPATVLENLARVNNSKVTIVAHSNGGLLAKALVSELQAQGKIHLVDRIIFIATPQLGTPKAIGSILHGYDQEKLGGWLIDDEVAREVITNMPGAYGLVPSVKYFSKVPGPVISFAPGTSTEAFLHAYGETIDNQAELTAFMTGASDGRPAAEDTHMASYANESMLNAAAALQTSTLDNWIAPGNIAIHEIVGTGLNTVKSFEYQSFSRRECLLGFISCDVVEYYEPVPLFTQYGDETVVAASADAYSGNGKAYFLNLEEVRQYDQNLLRKHFDITELPQLQQLLTNIMNGTAALPQFFSSTLPSNNESSFDIISTHSPVSLTLTGANGGVVGVSGSGESAVAVETIPGSSFQRFGSSTYIIVPSSENYIATVTGDAEGSYTLVVATQSGEAMPVTRSILAMATTTPQMVATFKKTAGEFSDVTTDLDGDGLIDSTSTLDGESPTAAVYADLRANLALLTSLKTSEINWLQSATDRAEKTGLAKGNDSAAVARIFDQMLGRLSSYVSTGLVTSAQFVTIEALMSEIKTRN